MSDRAPQFGRENRPGRACAGRARSLGFSLVELLVVIVIVATLLALLIPAVSSARAAAQRMQCQTNLRSLGQALLEFESGKGRFPYGRNEGEKYYDHSWSTMILPQLEEQALFDAYDFTRRWNEEMPRPDDSSYPPPTDAPLAAATASSAPGDETATDVLSDNGERSNKQISQTNLPVFQCPSVAHDHDGAIDFGGNYGTTLTGLENGFQKGQGWESGVLLAVNLQRMHSSQVRSRGVRLGEISDGASHTMIVMENAARPAEQGGQWANGHNCFSQDRPYINIQPSNEVYSQHRGIAHVLMADGSLMVLSDDIDRELLGALGTRAGRESVEIDP